MKQQGKLFLAAILIMLSITFTSCTDESEETIREIRQQEKKMDAPRVDPEKIKPPTGG
ncbi:hypothetical protein [Tenacibaculum maritimum]|uniref:hypothetical protein n=1 Tax=Tenacibaculum maritimum TaxID=107401 RepID=UPI00132F8BFB|nr:hypothetical protein [Tenacibaculum maritimum]